MAAGAEGVLPPGVTDVSTALKAQLDVHSCVFVRGVHVRTYVRTRQTVRGLDVRKLRCAFSRAVRSRWGGMYARTYARRENVSACRGDAAGPKSNSKH